jgi:hypothetical protein
LCIELMRQFYDEPRCFRITGEGGAAAFVPFSNRGLKAQPLGTAFGQQLGVRSPEFDIVVSAAKKSTFSRLSQNEMAEELYKLGIFRPENAQPALACLDMMDFDGIERVKALVQQNAQQQAMLAMMAAKAACGQVTGGAAQNNNAAKMPEGEKVTEKQAPAAPKAGSQNEPRPAQPDAAQKRAVKL